MVEWTELWYPLTDIGRLDVATAEAALGASVSGDTLTVGVHSTRPRAEGDTVLTVWQRADCSELAHWDVPAIDPATPFVVSTPAGGRALDALAVSYTGREGRLLAALSFRDCLPHVWLPLTLRQ